MLVRGDDTITCEIIYDSQQDSLQEHCVQGGSLEERGTQSETN